MAKKDCKHYRFDNMKNKDRSTNEEYCRILTELVCNRKNCTFYVPEEKKEN